MRTEALASLLLIVGLGSTFCSILLFHRGGDVERPAEEATPLKPHTTLIVGGTDGSGTRSVVYLLDKLGVPITADIIGTLDTDGKEIGGWPPTVRLLLNATRSADYDISDIPSAIREEVIDRIDNFWSKQWSRHRRHIFASTWSTQQSGVSWAFKAPVSMLLLPIFVEVSKRKEYGRIKFLHVIRDGRDIAYSGNQSPVKKFYNVSFPAEVYANQRDEEGARSMAIKLWSRWNSQVLAWCKRKVQQSMDFDSMVLHIEDLVSPDFETRRGAVESVARFVGSTVGDAGMCCIAEQKRIDLGSHTKMELNRDPVESRYGKWKTLATPEVLGQLNETGIEGLKTFGYEPWERPEDQINPILSTSCDLEACTDWTAPPSLITLLTRRKRIKEREAIAEAFVNKRMIRTYPEGKKALNARERLYQARHPTKHRRQDAIQARKNKVQEREAMMRMNHNKFRRYVPGLGG